MYSLILSLLPLVQFALSEEFKCESNGAEKTKLKAFYADVENGYGTYAYCENLDKNDCPQNYPHPYNSTSIKQCQKNNEEKDEDYKLINYTCFSHDQINEFVTKALENKWKCAMVA
ncbi:hypothetical protein CONCODRAFT_20618 [Conidiobolus coronatus NRRL 28638]|uniref:Secreted protein n=1 Tax=Conidiobolus coronatus (strain ATCC 28846 / CBS 209.66 / NRRL 28638) TaxID=796925 RepID=A0A137NSE2_CONC2|nr:hypothetical protein CONCODRAFT_20618 [Conidiobolus coronatus NRRL 28638]|eukprot:KXN65667.1 hypothetical protein CONCODRAFT_20618 [Conidiobolus coronatus NRRL 28638]